LKLDLAIRTHNQNLAMFRQAARPLARQQVSALTFARSLSTSKALPVRLLIQNVLDAQRRPQISPLLAQRALLTRQFVTSESRGASKDEPVAEKAVEKQSSVDFQHTTTGAKEEVGRQSRFRQGDARSEERLGVPL
jgi:hypothetical protein